MEIIYYILHITKICFDSVNSEEMYEILDSYSGL